MSNVFKKLLKKIEEFIKKLLGKDGDKPVNESKGSYVPSPPAKSPPKKPKPKPNSENPYEPVPSGHDSHGNVIYDPLESNPDGVIDRILWKPKSDHHPHNPVVVVGCAEIRKEDLKMEILGKSGKVLKVNIRNTGRANGNRVHFRIDRSAEKFKRSAPLQLRFYHKVKGKKKIVTFKGKKTFKVSKPTHRKDV